MNILAGLPEINTPLPDGTPETLVLHTMHEAFLYAKRCCRGKLHDDEILSACYEALSKAVKNFTPGKLRFFGYAKVYVRGALSSVWKSKNVVRTKDNINRERDWFNNDRRELRTDSGSYYEEQGIEEEAETETGITGVLYALRRKRSPGPICEPEFDSIQAREEYALLKPALKSLTDKEQSVIALKYRSGLNFQRIGDLLDTSRSDIQNTHARALRKLRNVAKRKLGLSQ